MHSPFSGGKGFPDLRLALGISGLICQVEDVPFTFLNKSLLPVSTSYKTSQAFGNPCIPLEGYEKGLLPVHWDPKSLQGLEHGIFQPLSSWPGMSPSKEASLVHSVKVSEEGHCFTLHFSKQNQY